MVEDVGGDESLDEPPIGGGGDRSHRNGGLAVWDAGGVGIGMLSRLESAWASAVE